MDEIAQKMMKHEATIKAKLLISPDEDLWKLGSDPLNQTELLEPPIDFFEKYHGVNPRDKTSWKDFIVRNKSRNEKIVKNYNDISHSGVQAV